MKKISLFPLCLAMIFLLFGCSQEKQGLPVHDSPGANVDYSLMDLSKVYTSLDEISQDSQLVVEVKLTDKSEEIAYKGANFVLSQVQIIDVVKGDPSYKDREIKIFEVKSFNMNLTKKSEHFILFLQKYEGPVTTDESYVITGVYQGKFGIDSQNNIMYDAEEYKGEDTFQSRELLINIDEFKEKIKTKN